MKKKIISIDKPKTRELQIQMSNIINSISSGILAVDKRGFILRYNNTVTDFLKRNPDYPSSIKNISFKDAFSPLTACEASFIRVISLESKLEEIEITQNDRIYQVNITPLKSEIIYGAVIIIDDITKAIKKQDHLLQVQKMETVSTMVGGFAHDFNNTLTGISASVSYLTQFVINEKDPDMNEIQESMQIIEGAVKQASGLINQLLTFSMKKEPEPFPVDMIPIIHHALNTSRQSLDKQIEFKINVPETQAVVIADPDQLEQVILNILINAGQAMTIMRDKNETPGGILSVDFEPETQWGKINIKTDEPDIRKYCKLTISDTGVGMNKEIRQKIFEPFFTTKHSGNGTGLGLAMVYGIIRQLGGEIDIDSTPGKGTVFNIYIPKEKQIPLTDKKEDNSPNLKRDVTLLIAEDENILRTAISKSLTACGFKVFSTKNGKEAIKCYKENFKNIDLVILDLIMPEMTGEEAYWVMKEINPDIEVLLTSGFKKDVRVEKLLESGIHHFMQKPYFKDDLLNYIDRILPNKDPKESK